MELKIKSFIILLSILSTTGTHASTTTPKNAIEILRQDAIEAKRLYNEYQGLTRAINSPVVSGKGSILLLPVYAPWLVMNQVIRIPILENERSKVASDLDKIINPDYIKKLLDDVINAAKPTGKIQEDHTDVIKDAIKLKRVAQDWEWIKTKDYAKEMVAVGKIFGAIADEDVAYFLYRNACYKNTKKIYSKLFAEFACQIYGGGDVNELFDLTWKQWFKKVFRCKRAQDLYREANPITT